MINKNTLFILLCMAPLTGNAVTYIHPTIPGTDADDPGQGDMAIDGHRAYPTISLSGAEDPTQSGYVREGNEWVETMLMITARKFGGRRFNVTGSDGRMVVPMPAERHQREDFRFPNLDDLD